VQNITKVIFIAGSGRCGSTLLDTSLGQLDGFFSCGELHLVWQRFLDPEWLCGCGSVLAACDVWSAVMRSAYGAHAVRECSRMTAIYRRWKRLRYSWALGGALAGGLVSEFRDRVGALYGAIRKVTGCRVIVDSSKSLAYGRIVQGIAGVDFHPVHLVRDPRAVAYSRHRRKIDRVAYGSPPRHLEVASTVRAAGNWARVVCLNEIFWRSAPGFSRLSYEHFVAHPLDSLQAIAKMAGESDSGVQIRGDRIRLRPTHTTGGNPVRFITGEVVVRADDEWRYRMSLGQRTIVNLICAPLAWSLHYPLATTPPIRNAADADINFVLEPRGVAIDSRPLDR
jgi:hypothetical protein